MSTLIASWVGTAPLTVAVTETPWDKTAQRFSVVGNYNITHVECWMGRALVGTNLTVAIYDRTNGNPNVSLGSKTIDVSGWSVAGSLKTITFDTPIAVSSGNYAIVVYSAVENNVWWAASSAGMGTGAIHHNSGDDLWYEVGDPTRSFYFKVWAADPVPSKPINPSPANAVSTVTLDQATISWENGGGATSYDVYYGVDAGHLNLVSSNQAGTSFTISGITSGSPFDYTVGRAWRIDAKNANGTTTGDVWTFTTITFASPAPGVRGFSGNGQGGYGGGTFADKQLNVKTRLVAFAANKVWYEDT